MKIKTSELTGAALDWAVAKAEGVDIDKFFDAWVKDPDEPHFNKQFKPSTDWAQGGPIIERERIAITPLTITVGDLAGTKEWFANYQDNESNGPFLDGPTPLISAMRCYVASKLGNEIEIPEELI